MPIWRWTRAGSCSSWSIPPRFEAYLRAGRKAEIQVNIDATAMQQASIGAAYIQNIINDRISSFLSRSDAKAELPVEIVVRKAFNPNGDTSWFTSIVAIINQVTTLTVILTGAALIREREHGTIEHLLVMPLTAFEIAMAKVWANGLVILVAVTASLFLVVKTILAVPIAGSPALFLFGVVLYLFFATALGIFLGTIARSMAQFALLIILIVIVLQLLSGGNTPVESQPALAAAAHVLPALAPLRRASRRRSSTEVRAFAAVWPHFLAVAGIGLAFFIFSLRRFRAVDRRDKVTEAVPTLTPWGRSNDATLCRSAPGPAQVTLNKCTRSECYRSENDR